MFATDLVPAWEGYLVNGTDITGRVSNGHRFISIVQTCQQCRSWLSALASLINCQHMLVSIGRRKDSLVWAQQYKFACVVGLEV